MSGGVLHGLDRVLAPLVWIVAAALTLMLFIGPQVIAEDKPAGGGAAATEEADGEQLFVDNCGSCHTLAAAETSGAIGPALDGTGLSADEIAETVSSGRGGMPAFAGQLDEAEIAAIAEYVEQTSAP